MTRMEEFEKNIERERKERIKGYVGCIENIYKNEQLEERNKEKYYQYYSDEIFRLLPEDIDVFMLSATVFSKKNDIVMGDMKILDLEDIKIEYVD